MPTSDSFSSNPSLARSNSSSTVDQNGDAIGETVGGVSGVLTGAALGSLGGPIGTIIGGVAGALGGWWSGRAISQAASHYTDDDDAAYAADFQRRQGLATTATGSVSTTPATGSQFGATAGSGNLASSGAPDTGTYGASSYDSYRPAYAVGHLASRNPDYDTQSFDEIEPELSRGWSASSSHTGQPWDSVRDHARTAFDRGRESRLTLSEEQLNVGKRQVSAGEATLSKTVDVEHVRQTVPLLHEEVSIERHPLSAADAVQGIQIGDETIRIPLMAEQAVVEKRVVPVEEVVLRKHAVTEQQTVEADLRHERLDTSGLNTSGLNSSGLNSSGLNSASLSGAADRATNSGPLDRLADKVDNVKDRFDGNPASRPGPDATDSRI